MNLLDIMEQPYPISAGYRVDGTSREAAASIDAAGIRAKVLAALATHGPMTADEAAERLRMTPFSVRPRFSELKADGKVPRHWNAPPQRIGEDGDGLEAQVSEEWRKVPGWPAYEVSSLGRVRRGDRCLKPWRTKAGRWQVGLCNGPEEKRFNVYRLVALAFLGPQPFPGAEVAHKNDDKDNNAVSNLKWCSHQENCRERRQNGRAAVGLRNGMHTKPHRRPRGETQGMAKLTWDAVAEIRNSADAHEVLALKFGVTPMSIRNVRKEKTWKCTAAA